MTSFHDFGLAEPIARALADNRYLTPTPIQAAAIPFPLAGRDLIGIAQTGTGKTAAFALPILHRLSAQRMRPERTSCRVLVLSPTRELSGQIAESFRTYGRHLRVSVALAIGGVPIARQVRAIAAGVDVLVATPGRLIDLATTGALRLDRVEILVLDEADRMLDMGFIQDIRAIVAKLPDRRQSLCFSATMARPIVDLANRILRDPAEVAVTPVGLDRRAHRPARHSRRSRGENVTAQRGAQTRRYRARARVHAEQPAAGPHELAALPFLQRRHRPRPNASLDDTSRAPR